MALSDTDDNGEISENEQETLLGLKRVVSLITGSTAEIFDGLRQAAAPTYVSAFPALEQDVLSYNLGTPKVPLVAVYPQDGTAEADFPYLILNAPWSTPAGQAAAGAFLSYARGAQGKAAFLAAGFRDGNRAPGPSLTAVNGVTAKITISGATTVFSLPAPTPCNQSQTLFMRSDDSSAARTHCSAASQ